MKIYTINRSEDGLVKTVYTNKKALYNGILETGYNCKTVGSYGNTKQFSYPNLCKMLVEFSEGGKYLEQTTVYCEGGSELEIQEHLISKQ